MILPERVFGRVSGTRSLRAGRSARGPGGRSPSGRDQAAQGLNTTPAALCPFDLTAREPPEHGIGHAEHRSFAVRTTSVQLVE